jgi:Tol biopolymer transport system component
MRELTADTAIDRLPRWSPDGKWLAFFTTRSGLLHIWKVRPDGSDLQIVRKEPAAYVVWSPDGSHLATGVGSRDGVNARSPGLVPADASAPDQRVDTLPPSSLGRLIANDWSPDGKRLAGQLDAVGSAGKGIAVFSLDTRTYERITAFGEWPVWLPDSRRLLFVANGNAFYVADTRTKEVRQVWAVKRDVLGPPRLTRDGRRAYFSRRVTEADIWLLTMRDGPSSTKR